MVNVCSSGDRLVSGRFNFQQAGDVSAQLSARGFPVVMSPSGIQVGCDQVSRELAQAGTTSAGMAATSPLASIALGGTGLGGVGASSGASVDAGPPPPPPPPPTFRQEVIRYRDPSPVIATLAKIPGLSVIADTTQPGPLLLAGPASVVAAASAYLHDLDRCPEQIGIEAVVVSSSETADRSRDFGVQVHGGVSRFGSFLPGAAATVSIPALKVYLDGLRESGEFRANSSLKSRVILGGTVKVQDGQDVPVRAATVASAVETRQDVVYRSVGNQMSVKFRAIDGDDVILEVTQELSSQTGDGQLGPVFTSRSVSSVVRVRIGEPAMISLSGADNASATHSRGIFSRADATSASKAGAFLVFALERLPCDAGPVAERSEARKPVAQGGAGVGDAKQGRAS